MMNDPIVDEVRAIREKLAAKFNFDLAAIVADAQEREKMHGNRVVDLRAELATSNGKKAS